MGLFSLKRAQGCPAAGVAFGPTSDFKFVKALIGRNARAASCL